MLKCVGVCSIIYTFTRTVCRYAGVPLISTLPPFWAVRVNSDTVSRRGRFVPPRLGGA